MRIGLRSETHDSETTAATLDDGSKSIATATLEVDGVLRLGRYPIIRKLGEGGMGVVYAGYDEVLDRRIAIKLINSRFRTGSARNRLEREAQALARLSHPNVVQIYEFGLEGDSLYLAMEFIDGQTLAEWSRASPRSWPEILDALVQAGRGLAAAHAAGLVHRDFKPDNVMVGRDGRVRVLDFGLVRGHAEPSDTEGSSAHDRRPLEPLVTQPGRILGTPAYMAPEQHEGRPSDAKADQFAWAVVAYEALFGTRPFAGSTSSAIAEAIRTGRIEVGEDRLGVPRGVRATIVRALAHAPDDRWPSLHALLDALGDGPSKRRRRWLAAGLVCLGGALAIPLWADAEREHAKPRCEISESALGDSWDDARRASVRAAFVRQGPDAKATLRLVENGFDAWAAAWLAQRRQNCEATWVDGVQSQALLDRRARCLEWRRRAFGVVTELFADADAELIARSPELLASLPELEPCADAELVELRHPLPDDPGRVDAIADGFTAIARARTLAAAGRLRDAEVELERLGDTSYDYPPLDLEIRGLAGERQLWHGQLEPGIEAILASARAAEARHLDDLVASLRVRAAVKAAGVWGHPERERWLLAEADAALARVGRDEDARQTELHAARGWFHDAAGDYAAALAEFEAARTLAADLGDPVRAELARVNVARALANLGRDEEAAREFEAAHAAAEQSFGRHSPRLAEIEIDLGLFAAKRGQAKAAAAHLERGRAILIAAFGDNPGKLARVDLARAKLALTTGDLERAALLFEAVAHTDAAAPEWRADAYEGIGVLRFYADDFSGSLTAYARALELRARVLAEDHPTIAILHSNIGESMAALGDHRGALVEYTRAIDALERTLPADHFDLAFPLKGRGKSRLALGELAPARDDLEAALALHEANPGEPLERSDVEFSCARALALLGELERARALAGTARDRYLELAQTKRAEAIDDWLATQQDR